MEEDQKHLTQKKAANLFVTKFSKVSDIAFDPEKERELRRKQRQLKIQMKEPADDVMTKPLTLDELNCGIDDLKERKAPGPDSIHNDAQAHGAPSQEETPRYLQYQLADRTLPKFMEESHHDSHTDALVILEPLMCKYNLDSHSLPPLVLSQHYSLPCAVHEYA